MSETLSDAERALLASLPHDGVADALQPGQLTLAREMEAAGHLTLFPVDGEVLAVVTKAGLRALLGPNVAVLPLRQRGTEPGPELMEIAGLVWEAIQTGAYLRSPQHAIACALLQERRHASAAEPPMPCPHPLARALRALRGSGATDGERDQEDAEALHRLLRAEGWTLRPLTPKETATNE